MYKCSFTKDFSESRDIEADGPEWAAESFLNDSDQYEDGATVFVSDGNAQMVYEIYVEVSFTHVGSIQNSKTLEEWRRKLL